MIQTEQVARIGAGVTGVSTATTFYATALPAVQFFAACIGVCVGVATFIYYAIAIIEKIRNLRKK